MDNQTLLSKADVHERLDISLATLNRLLRAGELRYLRIGGQVRFLPEHVEAYIRASEQRRNIEIPRSRRKRGRGAA